MTIHVPSIQTVLCTLYTANTQTYLFDLSMEKTPESQSRDLHSSLSSDTRQPCDLGSAYLWIKCQYL